MNPEDVKVGMRVVVIDLNLRVFDVQSDFIANRRVGMVGKTLNEIEGARHVAVWWVEDEKTKRIAPYHADEFELVPEKGERAHPPIDPCPHCRQAPTLFNGYDSRSGHGDASKGWIACRCGASMGAPRPADPYPRMTILQTVLAWNRRDSPTVTAKETRTIVLPESRPLPEDSSDDETW